MGYGLGLAGTWERARTVPALVGKWAWKGEQLLSD